MNLDIFTFFADMHCYLTSKNTHGVYVFCLLFIGFSAFSFIFLDLSFLHLSYPNQTGEIWKRQLTFVFEQGRRAGSTSRPRARENRTETISRVYRILPHPIYTTYISRDFQLPFLSSPHTYTKKREVRSFFTLIKGFAIPVTSRKTTEFHARYAKPTPPIAGRGMYNIPTGHSSCCSD